MSDYNIYIPTYNIATVVHRFESIDEETFTIIDDSPSASFPANDFDVVKVTIQHNGLLKTIYGVFKDQTYDGLEYRLICTYDSNVYGGIAEANTPVHTLEIFEIPANPILELKSYSLAPSLQVATYGKSFQPYNVRESYTITAPKERVQYNKNFRDLYSLEEKVLVDSCSGRCYKVSPTELSTVAFNGRITTALNFNVLIK